MIPKRRQAFKISKSAYAYTAAHGNIFTVLNFTKHNTVTNI
nr:MAG TPA: hypothetical protein [Caudoviricetes sp.]